MSLPARRVSSKRSLPPKIDEYEGCWKRDMVHTKEQIDWNFNDSLTDKTLREIELISDASTTGCALWDRGFHLSKQGTRASEHFSPKQLKVSKRMHLEAGSYFYNHQEFGFDTWTNFQLFLKKADQQLIHKTKSIRLPTLLRGIVQRDWKTGYEHEGGRVPTHAISRD
ncbi:MAG: hypothetical protein MMC33_010128 [Icmadophila ericetorum]|nr:hypothetical protein [Icmadophila ericetorum]